METGSGVVVHGGDSPGWSLCCRIRPVSAVSQLRETESPVRAMFSGG